MTVRVFLVEDMKQVHGIVAELLASVGDFQVVGVSRTEAEANLWLAEHPRAWDLAIVDLVLDQGSGMGVIPQARASGGTRASIAVFSDYASDGIRGHCVRLGADAVFMKSQTRELLEFCAELGGLETAVAP